MRYAVFGVTGQVGGATARALLKDGRQVRAVLRNSAAAEAWQASGAEIALADLHDGASLRSAFTEVDALFLLTPPYFQSSDPIAESRTTANVLRSAIEAAGVPYVVYLSSIGAQHSTRLGAIRTKHDLEQTIRTLDIPTVAIRAGWFMENYRGQVAPAQVTGTLPSMLDTLDLRVPMIATEDIGRVAADLLQLPAPCNGIVELATESYSSNDVAQTLSSILRRDVTPSVISREQRIDTYVSWGFSNEAAREMTAMIDGFNSGWIAFEGGTAERLRGTTTLESALTKMAVEVSLAPA